MAQPDPQVSALLGKHIAHHTTNASEDDTDALFAALEEEDDSAFRAARTQQLSEELKKYKPAGLDVGGHVQLVQTLRNDDEVLRFTTENGKAVLHFLHSDFARCSVMDEHLDTVANAQARFEDGGGSEKARFGRVDVKDAGFVVEKLGIRVLPCVVGFKAGVAVGRIVGFEGLVWGGKEDGREVTKGLEAKLVEWGLLGRVVVGRGEMDEESDSAGEAEATLKKGRRGIQSSRKKHDDQDDDEWD